MATEKHEPLSEEQFQREIERLLAAHPAKVWLARSNGHRLDVVFSVGASQPEPIHLFDQEEGFYLLGEGVPPESISAIHALFERYCRTHKGIPLHLRDLPIHVQYKSFGHRHAHPTRLTIRYPLFHRALSVTPPPEGY